MAEAVINVAADQAVRPLVDSIATQLGYIWNYKTNFDNLEKQVQELQGRRDMVQHAVEEAKRNGEEIERQVVNWLDSVNKMIDEATEIVDANKQANMKCFKRLCPDLKKRYQHSKKAAGKAKDVVRLREDGKFDKVSYRTIPKETWHPSNKLYEDFESRRSTVENILNALRNPDTNMVEVYGMGGVGKTTLVNEVGKQAEEQKLFVAVVFVEVSEKPDTRKIQGEIADKLGLEFREETESGRARKLCERLKKESNILLILDNIWKDLDLATIGVPFGNEHRGCKLLLTSRSVNVLSNDMNSSKNFSIGNLNEKEAWDLFRMVAGACIEQHKSLALEVAKRCGGLPIAIVTIARALKDKPVHEWRNALGELNRPSAENLEGSVTAEAYSCIRLSYNYLETDELKSTFLLCSTIAFTYNASIENLLRYGMGLNLFRAVYTMKEARDRVITLVQKLKYCSLLLEDTPSNGEGFSIHDVVRDVGRSIATKDHNQFTVIEGIIPREWKEKNILKSCTSIYLHDITELPNKELDCPLLKFLYMKGRNKHSKIPDNFFIGMLNLRVLHLINMELSPLPTSLCCLVNLRTLCLNCSWLRDMGFIVDMKDLEILVLSCGTIKQLPIEIGQLTQLRVLDLSNCHSLEVIPPSIISKLTQLEELYMSYGFDKWHVEGLDNESKNASLDELKHLSQLTTLHICIPDSKIVPKGLFSHKLQRYQIYIGVSRWEIYSVYKTPRLLELKYDDANLCVEDGVVKQLKGIEDLTLVGKQGVKNVLHELDRDGFPRLKHFDVEDNPVLVYLVDFSKQLEPCVAFPHLETLSLSDLNSFEQICHGQLTPNSFCQLRTIKVKRCVKLKNTFSSSISRHFSQLQDIKVGDCVNMEEIFTMGRENEVIVLDQLHSLSLYKLPKLKSFCYEEEVASTSNQERQILDTPMPLFDKKVKFCNLRTLKLHTITLKYVFSSSTLGSFVQLQDLDINNCKVLEEIIRIDDLEDNVELSSLKSLKIETCSEVKAFIFNDKVSFPNLEEIQISNMKNLEMIWHNQFTKDSMNAQNCQKLCKVVVNNCQNLKNLFPPSIARNLFQLKDLYVKRCGIEQVVAKEGADDVAARLFVFPQLTYLKLKNLQELKCFYPGIHTIEWPAVMELNIIGCDKIDQLFALQLFTLQEHTLKDQLDISTQPLHLVKKVLCNLEKLRLDGNNIRMICMALFPEILFPKLKLLTIQGDKSTDLPLEIFQRSHNLERLSLLKCSGYKEIFLCEEAEKYIQIKNLSISYLENLKQIWKQDCKVNAVLQNLEKLSVRRCSSLVTLIPHSACFQNLTILRVSFCNGLLNLVSSSTAKSLVQLTEMTIRYCNMITEVVADNRGRTEDYEINFSKLKSLELDDLSRLTSFSSLNYTFNFPSLENLTVGSCSKMKIFTSGVVITPMLREIHLDYKRYYCEGDVNTTMQQIKENLVLSGERLSLSVREVKMILQKFPQHQFSELKCLVVFDDESTVLSFAMLQRFHNLKNLKLTDCSYKEIFSCEEVEKYAGTLVQLKSLDLDKLDDLEQLWKEDSKLDLILQNLKTLNVNECNSLITLMPASASFQNLKDLTVWRCKGLISLVSSSTAKTLVQLEYMRIDDCDVMTEIVANEDVKEDNIIFSKLKRLLLVDLSSLTSFCSVNYTLNFPSLEYLYLSKCSKMKLFSSGVLHTPMLQQINYSLQKNIWEGDLNTTVQQIYEELNPNSDGAGPSTQYLE
ncbi:hypothetical protein ACOSQ4_021603 [Xanthoceras sorbifolium]